MWTPRGWVNTWRRLEVLRFRHVARFPPNKPVTISKLFLGHLHQSPYSRPKKLPLTSWAVNPLFEPILVVIILENYCFGQYLPTGVMIFLIEMHDF